MAQTLEFNWTNPATVVPVNIAVGFSIARITVYDTTAGNVYSWVSQMTAGEYLQLGQSGVQTTNGFTPSGSQALFGAPIVGFQQISAPMAFQCEYLNLFNFQAGDTVLATDMAETGTGKTINGFYTVASVSGQNVNLAGGAQASGYMEYAAGGILVRVKDALGNPVPIRNHAVYGGTIGTGMAGAAGSVISCIVEGAMNVT